MALYIDNDRVFIKDFILVSPRKNLSFLFVDIKNMGIKPIKFAKVFVDKGLYNYYFKKLSLGFLIAESKESFNIKKVGEHEYIATVSNQNKKVYGVYKEEIRELKECLEYNNVKFYHCPYPMFKIGNGVFQMDKEAFEMNVSIYGGDLGEVELATSSLGTVSFGDVELGDFTISDVSLNATLPNISYRRI